MGTLLPLAPELAPALWAMVALKATEPRPGRSSCFLLIPVGRSSRKEFGVWTVPKGEYEEGEEAITAAEREFAEEIGLAAPSGERLDLGEVRQSSGKRVRAFAIEGDLDLSGTTSNTFEMEWPPGSGTVARFPEIDRAEWFGAEEARRRLNPSQAEFVDRLLARLGG